MQTNLPTVKIRHRVRDIKMIINERDFDPEVHEFIGKASSFIEALVDQFKAQKSKTAEQPAETPECADVMIAAGADDELIAQAEKMAVDPQFFSMEHADLVSLAKEHYELDVDPETMEHLELAKTLTDIEDMVEALEEDDQVRAECARAENNVDPDTLEIVED